MPNICLGVLIGIGILTLIALGMLWWASKHAPYEPGTRDND